MASHLLDAGSAHACLYLCAGIGERLCARKDGVALSLSVAAGHPRCPQGGLCALLVHRPSFLQAVAQTPELGKSDRSCAGPVVRNHCAVRQFHRQPAAGGAPGGVLF